MVSIFLENIRMSVGSCGIPVLQPVVIFEQNAQQQVLQFGQFETQNGDSCNGTKARFTFRMFVSLFP